MQKVVFFLNISAKLFIILTITLFVSCNQGEETVQTDAEFSSLFYADSGGILCADGIFSVPLPDGSSVFFVGDCFVGKLVNGGIDPKTPMLRNAFNFIDRKMTKAQAIIGGTIKNPQTLMTPPRSEHDSVYRWYWPGHGFTKGDTLYVFALNLYNDPAAINKSDKEEEEKDEMDKMAEEMFAFRIAGIDLLAYKLPDFIHLATNRVEYDYSKYPIDFGNCVMVDNGYVYIYGTKNEPHFSKIHVARIPLNSKVLYKDWEFFNGSGWDTSIAASAPIETDISVSEQFSIFKYRNKYVLLTMERAGSDIYNYIADSPTGVFTNKKFQYCPPEPEQDSTGRIFVYNALAHPQYIRNDKLLVSYCVNSFHVRDVYRNAENYRARFLRIPMKNIVGK